MIGRQLILPLMKGAATYIPFLYSAHRGSTGGTSDGRYCYSVWFRHYLALQIAGRSGPLRSVAELGPGDSLGIGLMAMLCGATSLTALDVVPYAQNKDNFRILAELCSLLTGRAAIPGDEEFPDVLPKLKDYSFPDQLFVERSTLDSELGQCCADISGALECGLAGNKKIAYCVPWNARDVERQQFVDVVFSQAVLEHVNDLQGTYEALAQWVAPGGWMSHVVDFRSHRLSPAWDGHLAYGELSWQVVCGRRPYLLNRVPPSQHFDLMRQCGFEIISVSRDIRVPELAGKHLARKFRSWSDEDRSTAGMHVIARRAN